MQLRKNTLPWMIRERPGCAWNANTRHCILQPSTLQVGSCNISNYRACWAPFSWCLLYILHACTGDWTEDSRCRRQDYLYKCTCSSCCIFPSSPTLSSPFVFWFLSHVSYMYDDDAKKLDGTREKSRWRWWWCIVLISLWQQLECFSTTKE